MYSTLEKRELNAHDSAKHREKYVKQRKPGDGGKLMQAHCLAHCC